MLATTSVRVMRSTAGSRHDSRPSLPAIARGGDGRVCDGAAHARARVGDDRRTSVRVAMQMTGHKTRGVFERHKIVSAGDLREAAKRLDAVAGTISGTIEQNRTVQPKV